MSEHGLKKGHARLLKTDRALEELQSALSLHDSMVNQRAERSKSLQLSSQQSAVSPGPSIASTTVVEIRKEGGELQPAPPVEGPPHTHRFTRRKSIGRVPREEVPVPTLPVENAAAEGTVATEGNAAAENTVGAQQQTQGDPTPALAEGIDSTWLPPELTAAGHKKLLEIEEEEYDDENVSTSSFPACSVHLLWPYRQDETWMVAGRASTSFIRQSAQMREMDDLDLARREAAIAAGREAIDRLRTRSAKRDVKALEQLTDHLEVSIRTIAQIVTLAWLVGCGSAQRG